MKSMHIKSPSSVFAKLLPVHILISSVIDLSYTIHAKSAFVAVAHNIISQSLPEASGKIIGCI